MASDEPPQTPATQTKQVTRPDPVVVNISPVGFYAWAQDFYDCRQSFTPRNFSPVPYLLLCRSIELALKSQLLHTNTRQEIKKNHRHSLVSCYKALPDEKKVLDPGELAVVQQADLIYREKGMEYATVGVYDFPIPMKGLPKLPDLGALDGIAAKLLAAARQQIGLGPL